MSDECCGYGCEEFADLYSLYEVAMILYRSPARVVCCSGTAWLPPSMDFIPLQPTDERHSAAERDYIRWHLS